MMWLVKSTIILWFVLLVPWLSDIVSCHFKSNNIMWYTSQLFIRVTKNEYYFWYAFLKKEFHTTRNMFCCSFLVICFFTTYVSNPANYLCTSNTGWVYTCKKLSLYFFKNLFLMQSTCRKNLFLKISNADMFVKSETRIVYILLMLWIKR